MNESETFIYNFIHNLGKFYPLQISLLGVNFYSKFSESIIKIDEAFIGNYKSFLLDQRSQLVSIRNNSNDVYINWIREFINSELVDAEYVGIFRHGINRFGHNVIIDTIFHSLTDILTLESIPVNLRIITLISRIKILSENLNEDFSIVTTPSFFWLLSGFQFMSRATVLYEVIKKFIFESNIEFNQSDFNEYYSKLINNTKILENSIKDKLLDYKPAEISYQERRNLIEKVFEYKLEIKNTLEEKYTSLNHEKSILLSEIINKFNIKDEETNYAKLLNNYRFTTKLKKQNVIDYFQSSLDKIKTIFSKFDYFKENYDLDKQIELKLVPENFSYIFRSSLTINSSKKKRNDLAEYWIPIQLEYNHSTIIIETILNIFPGYLAISDNSFAKSYIYQILDCPESVEAINLFLIYFLTTNLPEDNELLSDFYYRSFYMLEIAIMDIGLNLKSETEKYDLKKILNISELESDFILDKLNIITGSSYISYITYLKLKTSFESLKEKSGINIAINNLFSIINRYYGAPPKLIINELNKLTNNN